MVTSEDILFEVRGRVAFVTFNRPKALNALTLPMIEEFLPLLRVWAEDPAIKAVVTMGSGDRAYCAGGDVRAVWQSGKEGGSLTREFFRAEYRLNRQIRVFEKPYVSLIDGVSMGGGFGLSAHGSHRVVSERALFAMPECSIGLFPDVGGTYLLPRMRGALGFFLGLTGTRLKAADCCYCGYATNFVESSRLAEVQEALLAADWAEAEPQEVVDGVLASLAGDAGSPSLASLQDAIDRCFSKPSIEAVLDALVAEKNDWGETVRAGMLKSSPTSLKLALRALRRGAELEFDEAMRMEYRLSQACMAGHDFYEGIRALLVDKDGAPRWQPKSLEDVSEELIEHFFAPLGANELTFE